MKSAELFKAQAHIFKQVFCFTNGASLKCAVQLGIPDAIDNHGKAMTLSELTDALPINPSKAPHIHRLMRILVTAGFFVEERLGNGKEEKANGYALTPSSRLLLKNKPLSLRASALTMLDPVTVKTWNALSEWFQNEDQTAFETAHGKNMWDFFAEDPGLSKKFNESMASDSQLVTEVLVTKCKFVFEGLTSMVDVGGGTGTVAGAIAKTFPSLRCTVFDLPHVVANLEPTENLDFVAGDMFGKIPPANAIFLKWVLHDWNDEDCVKILKNCKRAIPGKEKGGKVIIVDIIMETEKHDIDEFDYAKMCMDMEMLVLCNSKERTEKELAMLVSEAGFSGYKIFPVLGIRSLIEVYP
uniref:Noribogaine 10-O-methyltransferase n=1 Tax=Tabernanthe iboga TaxID=141617 RepID=N10MT_TABIB